MLFEKTGHKSRSVIKKMLFDTLENRSQVKINEKMLSDTLENRSLVKVNEKMLLDTLENRSQVKVRDKNKCVSCARLVKFFKTFSSYIKYLTERLD